jgi:hypothetical protein
MVPLRCWSTTPDERGTAAKIPHHQEILGGTRQEALTKTYVAWPRLRDQSRA